MRAKCTQILFSSSRSSLLLDGSPAPLFLPVVIRLLGEHYALCCFLLLSLKPGFLVRLEVWSTVVTDVADGELGLFERLFASLALAEVDFTRLIGLDGVGYERDGYETVLHNRFLCLMSNRTWLHGR